MYFSTLGLKGRMWVSVVLEMDGVSVGVVRQ